MISITKQSGKETTYVTEFVADTESEIATLPTNCAIGSTCFIIENSSVYMLNGSRIWTII